MIVITNVREWLNNLQVFGSYILLQVLRISVTDRSVFGGYLLYTDYLLIFKKYLRAPVVDVYLINN